MFLDFLLIINYIYVCKGNRRRAFKISVDNLVGRSSKGRWKWKPEFRIQLLVYGFVRAVRIYFYLITIPLLQISEHVLESNSMCVLFILSNLFEA